MNLSPCSDHPAGDFPGVWAQGVFRSSEPFISIFSPDFQNNADITLNGVHLLDLREDLQSHHALAFAPAIGVNMNKYQKGLQARRRRQFGHRRPLAEKSNVINLSMPIKAMETVKAPSLAVNLGSLLNLVPIDPDSEPELAELVQRLSPDELVNRLMPLFDSGCPQPV